MSQHLLRFRNATLVVCLMTASSPGAILMADALQPLPATDASTRLEADPLKPEQLELLDWAVDRFHLAGLEFPEVELIFHEDTATCEGHVGLFYPASSTIHMCRLDERSILHELAHAWALENLDENKRAAFLRHRGLASWNDHETEWDQRGTEHAAEIITWALMNRNTLVRWNTTTDDGEQYTTYRLLTIEESDPDQLAAGYQLLTSRSPDDRLRDDPRSAVQVESFSPEAGR